MGGGWALVLSKDKLLKCRTNDDRSSSAGVRWGRVGKVMYASICVGCSIG